MDDQAEFDWQAFVFNPEEQWLDRLERVAARRFPNSSMSGSAFNFAFERVSQDDWALLGGFDGSARPGTYLTVIFTRLLEDYSRSVFGRARPPAWLVRMGAFWRQVHRMLCLERLEAEMIIDRFRSRVEDAEAQVSQTIRTIKARIPDCGKRTGEILLADPQADAGRAAADQGADEVLMQDDVQELLTTLRLLLLDEATAEPARATSNPGEVANGLPDRLRKLRAIVMTLEDDEHLILKLQYQENMKLSQVARAMKLPDHKVRRISRRAVRKLGLALAEAEVQSAGEGALAD